MRPLHLIAVLLVLTAYAPSAFAQTDRSGGARTTQVVDGPADTGWELTEGGRDVALFDALLARIRTSHCVGTVYSMGHSFGGYMSNALACFRGGQGDGDVRAIASIAGGGPFGACGGDPVSAVIIHGSADSVVPYAQGEASRDTWRTEAGCDPSGSPVDPSPCVAYDGCASPLVVQVLMSMGFALLAEGALAYLGLSVQPPDASLGSMLQQGFSFINFTPRLVLVPGIVIVILSASFNAVADGIRDALAKQGREVPGRSQQVAA